MNRQFPNSSTPRTHSNSTNRLQGNIEPLKQPPVQGIPPQYRFNLSNMEVDPKKKINSRETVAMVSKLKKYNTRLIFMNFIFLIIALIAIISLLFMPFAKINIKLDNKTISNTVDRINEEQFKNTFNGYLTKSDIQNATKDISVNFGVCNFKTYDFLKLGIDKDLSKTKQVLIEHIKNNWVTPISNLVTQATPAVLALSARMAIATVAQNINISVEQFDTLLSSAQTAMDSLKSGDVDTATNEIMKAITPILTANNLDTQKDTIQKQVKEVLTIIKNNATSESGEFSFNTMIGNLESILSEITSLNSKEARLATQTDTTNASSDMIGNIIENIANPDKVVNDLLANLSDSQKQMLSYGIFAFGLLTCFSVAIWALLVLAILFSFIRRKKSVSLWSVIWLGGLQSIWMLPFIFLTVFNLTSIIQYISFSWIALVASIVTMLFYFLFYREAKKQSKKIRKKF